MKGLPICVVGTLVLELHYKGPYLRSKLRRRHEKIANAIAETCPQTRVEIDKDVYKTDLRDEIESVWGRYITPGSQKAEGVWDAAFKPRLTGCAGATK